jgi:PAS domain S-box-containing protein
MSRQDSSGEEPIRNGSGRVRGPRAVKLGLPELKTLNAQLTEEIHDLKIAEAVLRKSEERFRLMVQNAHEGIFVTFGGIFRFLNPRIVEIIGHPLEALLSRPFTDFIHPDDGPMVLQRHYQRLHGENVTSRYPLRMVDRNGKEKWVEIDNAVINWEGSPAVLGFMTDITERKRAEEALRQSEEKYRTIIENIEEGYYEVDLAGVHVFVNNSLCEILGYSHDELIGKGYHLYIEKKNRARTYQTFHNVYKAGTPATANDWTIVRKEGSRRFVEVSASIIWGYHGQRIGFRGIMRDVTERKLIEEELNRHRLHLKRMVGERTAELRRTNKQLRLEITERKKAQKALAHSEKQLRLLSSQLLKAQEKERKRVAQELHDGIGQQLTAIKFRLEQAIGQVDERHACVEPLLTVIPTIQNAIREVRRISMDLRPATLDQVGVLATIAWFCREFQATFLNVRVEKRIGLEEEDVPEPLKIVIFRVLQEALNNVGKHSNADFVSICLEKKVGRIELTVQDNGVGLHRDDEFAESSDRRGFGLASMRERAELSGGSFVIEASEPTGTVIRCSWAEDARKSIRG